MSGVRIKTIIAACVAVSGVLASYGGGGTDLVPPAVTNAAHQLAVAKYTNSLEQAAYRDAFVLGVYSGLTCDAAAKSRAYSYNGPDPSQQGMADALRAVLGLPRMDGLADLTLQDYGYSLIVATGTCYHKSGIRTFVPQDSRDRWLLAINEQFGDARHECIAKTERQDVRAEELLFVISGYLSPSFAGGDVQRRFVVDRVTDVQVKDATSK